MAIRTVARHQLGRREPVEVTFYDWIPLGTVPAIELGRRAAERSAALAQAMAWGMLDLKTEREQVGRGCPPATLGGRPAPGATLRIAPASG